MNMPALNRIQLIGRFGKDPETRFTPTGKKVAQFSVAISNRWKSAMGEMKEYTEWVNIEAWGRRAKFASSTSIRAASFILKVA
jgi:single-strand DNA-binding protein